MVSKLRIIWKQTVLARSLALSLSGPNLVSHLLQSPRAVVLAAAALAAEPAADELVEAAAAAVTAA